MKFFSNKSRLLWVFIILMLSIFLFFEWRNFRRGDYFSQEVSKFAAREAKRQIVWQEVSKSLAAQTAKVEPSKQAAKVGIAKKPAEKPQGTETELRKEMLNPAGDLEARLGAAKGWAKEHVSNAEKNAPLTRKRCIAATLILNSKICSGERR